MVGSLNQSQPIAVATILRTRMIMSREDGHLHCFRGRDRVMVVLCCDDGLLSLVLGLYIHGIVILGSGLSPVLLKY